MINLYWDLFSSNKINRFWACAAAIIISFASFLTLPNQAMYPHQVGRCVKSINIVINIFYFGIIPFFFKKSRKAVSTSATILVSSSAASFLSVLCNSGEVYKVIALVFLFVSFVVNGLSL